jgi:hypothetical protein
MYTVAMSGLERRLRAAVSDYIGNRLSAADLDRIVGELLYVAADELDGDSLILASTIALRLSEFWDGAWTEPELKHHLEPLTESVTLHAALQWPEIGLVAPNYSTSAVASRTSETG